MSLDQRDQPTLSPRPESLATGQVHCLPEIDDMPGAFAINNRQTRQFTILLLDIQFSWSLNVVVKVLHRDLDDVIPWGRKRYR